MAATNGIWQRPTSIELPQLRQAPRLHIAAWVQAPLRTLPRMVRGGGDPRMSRKVEVSREVYAALERKGRALGFSPSELATKLLELDMRSIRKLRRRQVKSE